MSGLPISFAGSSLVPPISSSSRSPSSFPARGASGASKGLSEIGKGVDSESFCGDAEDVLGYGVARFSSGAFPFDVQSSALTNCAAKTGSRSEVNYLHHSRKNLDKKYWYLHSLAPVSFGETGQGCSMELGQTSDQGPMSLLPFPLTGYRSMLRCEVLRCHWWAAIAARSPEVYELRLETRGHDSVCYS